MANIADLFKRMTCGMVLAGVPLIGGCGDNTQTWTEEVKLLDGRVITVTQRRRTDIENVAREFWLTFKLAEYGNQEIVWHTNLLPRVINIFQNTVYVVGVPNTEREFRQYGNPNPSYLGYRYEAGKWQQIPFSEIPVAIYDTNLLISNEPPKGMTFVSFAVKADEFKDETMPQYLKRIDPKHVSLNY